jgi:hypothetical protein
VPPIWISHNNQSVRRDRTRGDVLITVSLGDTVRGSFTVWLNNLCVPANGDGNTFFKQHNNHPIWTMEQPQTRCLWLMIFNSKRIIAQSTATAIAIVIRRKEPCTIINYLPDKDKKVWIGVRNCFQHEALKEHSMKKHREDGNWWCIMMLLLIFDNSIMLSFCNRLLNYLVSLFMPLRSHISSNQKHHMKYLVWSSLLSC